MVPAGAPQTQAWANDADIAVTILASGPDETDWQWQLSIVDITHDSVFPACPDIRRQCVALDAPMRLQRDDQPDTALLRLSVTRIDDTCPLRVQIPEGATRVFNLMLRGNAEGELIARPLNGSMWLPVREQWLWFVHLLSGHAHLQAGDEHTELDMGSSVWMDAQPGDRARIEGGGELLLVHLPKKPVPGRLG
nr:HutD family protein [Dyella flava]